MTVDIKWRPGCFYELRTEPRVRSALEAAGRRVMKAANATLREGRGYKMDSKRGRRSPQGRWRVTVYTDSVHAKRSNARHNTLVRVMGQARG